MAGTSFFHNLFKKFMGNFNQLNFIIQYNIFYKYRYFFFESVFKSLLNHRQKVSQIRNCIVCVVTRHVFVFWPSTGRCIVFQYIFGNQKKSEFYGPNSHSFSCGSRYHEQFFFILGSISPLFSLIIQGNNRGWLADFENMPWTEWWEERVVDKVKDEEDDSITFLNLFDNEDLQGFSWSISPLRIINLI